jgi:hypothetical protein
VDIFVVFEGIFLLKVDSFKEFSSSVGVTPLLLVFIFRSTNFLINREKIKSLYECLDELIGECSNIDKKKGSKLKQTNRQIDRIFKIFMTFATVSVSMTVVIVSFAHELPVRMWFPFDYTSSEVLFWSLALYQITEGFIMTPIGVAIETFPTFFLGYLTGIIIDLGQRFEEIGVRKVHVAKLQGNTNSQAHKRSKPYSYSRVKFT